MTDLPSTTPASEEEPGDERMTLGQRFSVALYTTMERAAMRWPERPARALF